MPAASKPAASVIVAACNAAPFIQATLHSVLDQTFSDFELIVVDDGSTDGTAEQLRQYRDARLRIISQANRGAPAAMNAGLRAARGDYIAFLDHDDLWLPTKLARHIEFLEAHPEVDLTFSWSGLIDETGRRLGLHWRRWRGAISFRELLIDFVIGSTSAVVMRRAALEGAGWFDPGISRYYDMDLFLRVALLRPNNIRAIPEELVLYRRHSRQMSRDWQAMKLDWDQMLQKFRRLAPKQTAAVERRAGSNMHRYFAYLAYENREFRRGCDLLRDAFRHSPAAFLTELRNWKVGAACLAGLLLPAGIHRGLERLAGIRW